ncbi:MAG TPA: phosphatase PAP2 family protein [Anaeromyxobacter sp.]|nr:phosphatase PAP2 family protein [Anaeromyxobacter sp.]
MSEARIPGFEVELGDPALALEGSGGVADRTGPFRRLLSADEALLLAFQRFRAPWRTAVARALTRAGDARSWTVVGLALLATCSVPGVHLGLRLAAAALGATALSQALKRTLSRTRPDVRIAGFEALAQNPDRFSFPSGHTAAAFAVAVAFAGEPYAAGPVSLLLALGIALSRVYLGAHYPLDVGAGALLGAFAGALARLLVA